MEHRWLEQGGGGGRESAIELKCSLALTCETSTRHRRRRLVTASEWVAPLAVYIYGRLRPDRPSTNSMEAAI